MLCVLLMFLPRSLEVAEEEMTKDLTAIAMMMMTYKNGDAAAPLIVTTNQHAW